MISNAPEGHLATPAGKPAWKVPATESVVFHTADDGRLLYVTPAKVSDGPSETLFPGTSWKVL